MKKNLLLAGAICALVPTGAMAADLGVGTVAVTGTWDRTYVGAQFGLANLNSDWTIDDFGFEDASLANSCFVLGVFGGHDVQMEGFVLGAEADFNFMDCGDSANFISGGEGGTLTVSTSVDAIGSVRGRLGIPVDNLLFYATAGIAAGTTTVSYDSFPFSADEHDLKFGLVAGAGVEAMVTDNVGIRLQGLFYDFGSHTFDNFGATYEADASVFTLTAGVTWKF